MNETIIVTQQRGRFKFTFESIQSTLIVCDKINRKYRLKNEDDLFLPFSSISAEGKFALTKSSIIIDEYRKAILTLFANQFIVTSDLKNGYSDLDAKYKLIERNS